MRRFQTLLIAAGLAAAPALAVAGPSKDPSTVVEKFEWSTSKGRLGMMVMSLTPELRKHFGTSEDRGVLVAHVEPGTPAAAAGIAVGDVIVEVRNKPIERASDVLSAIATTTKGQTVTIQLVRAGKPRSIQATLTDDPMPRMFDGKWPSPFDEDWFRELRERLRPTKPTDHSVRS